METIRGSCFPWRVGATYQSKLFKIKFFKRKRKEKKNIINFCFELIFLAFLLFLLNDVYFFVVLYFTIGFNLSRVLDQSLWPKWDIYLGRCQLSKIMTMTIELYLILICKIISILFFCRGFTVQTLSTYVVIIV